MPIYEPLFADGSFGYRPNRSAKEAVHMETMETKDKSAKPNQDGSAEGLGVAGRKQSQGILVHNTHGCQNMAMTKERLINSGFYDLATAYQSMHVKLLKAPDTRTVCPAL